MKGSRTTILTLECLGLPGAGKTRFCVSLGSSLHDAGIAAEVNIRGRGSLADRLHTAGRVLSLLVHRPGYCRRSVRLIRAAAPTDRWWLTRAWLKRSAGAATASTALQLTDAGIAQALWSLVFRARSQHTDEILAALAAAAPAADLLVVLDVDRDCLAERLTLRSGAESRLERLLAADGTVIDRGLHLVDLVAAALGDRQRRPTRVLRLRNNDEEDLRRNVECIRAELEVV